MTAILNILNIKNKKSKITTVPPIRPCSSLITEYIKSVWLSGRKLKCAWVPPRNPLPLIPPLPIINAGTTVGMVPIVGIPMPFVSYGGTSLLSFFTMVGIVNSIHLRRYSLTD